MSQSEQVAPEVLLEAAFAELGFAEGDLLPAESQPGDKTRDQWLEKGDWLALAKSVGAERIFFVDQHPVVVFAKSEDENEAALRALYNRIWCMARPQLLFLAMPGELAVYDLGKPPIRPGERADDNGRLVSHKIRVVAQVQEKLGQFRREEIETGRLWEEARLADANNRADKALVRDLRIVRQKLIGQGLKARYAHALIGRSIFIRYLEDRAVLVRSYFENIAARRSIWKNLLEGPPGDLFKESDLISLWYPRVLKDKDFTYALFKELAKDFNGDIFPVEEEERENVKPKHLELLRGLLLGDVTEQLQLFFFAYKFDVIPIELISSIYEEFYNDAQGVDRNHGSHYTPGALVEFVLSQTLTPEVLERSPRVTDSACGSGIFLVESFRRIVRHEICRHNGKRLSRLQLRRILRDQIAGIDINEEAVRVAAFSLYLAFLHYQEPREINEQRWLPNLKWTKRANRDPEQHFDILLHGNAFEAVDGTSETDIVKRFGSASTDVLVGNPPWGYPGKDDELGRRALGRALEWCNEKAERAIGDKELSQAFIHLALEMLRDGGRAGLLVSSGVLFKHRKNSREFRRSWLSRARLHQIVNFAQVRHVFFRGESRRTDAIAPFIAAVFEKTKTNFDSRFGYWSAKRTALVESAQAVVLSSADMHWLSQRDCLNDERLWKIYWWGGHRDQALIQSLERFPRLIDLPQIVPNARIIPGFGFVEGAVGKKPSGWLKEFKELPIEAFQSYGPLYLSRLREVPSSVERRCNREAYEGHRLLVRRGIPTGGKLTARLESRSFCFRHSIFAFHLEGFQAWQEKTLLAIFWSSIARYYLFLTTGSWGMWHDELNLEIAGKLPIAFPSDPTLKAKVLNCVEKLQSIPLTSESFELERPNIRERIRELEGQLDEAVFDLYELTSAERELVQDMSEVGLDFLYRNQSSLATKPVSLTARKWGTEADVVRSQAGIGPYLKAFLQIWNRTLASETELGWRVLSPGRHSPLLAVLFSTRTRSDEIKPPEQNDESAWADVLKTLDKSSLQTSGSRRIYTDTFVRLVTDDEILLIKRNEVRFWTRSAAREDAEATQLQAMRLQEAAAR